MASQTLKYIVLSDLHLGESDSLFTPQDGEDYALLEAFSDCLADLLFHFNQGELPGFILNGDILGLSFSTYQQSLRTFEHLVHALTVRNRLCERVAYIPGNHDHHIWHMSMEEDYRARLMNRDEKTSFPELHSSTGPRYEDGLGSPLFEAFMQKSENKPEFKVMYPNFLLPPNGPKEPYVLFHHGHFAESTYHFVSKAMRALYPELGTPETTSELEMQNGAWIDFAFSTLGRSGEAGAYFEHLTATLSSKELLEKEKSELAGNLADALDFPFLPFRWMEKLLAERLIVNIAEKFRSERYKRDTVCSEETMDGLLHYLNTFCRQVLESSGRERQPVTLVWSHTHKPFEKIIETPSFGNMKTVNTGGWVLSPTTSPSHGASIILINQANEVQALRIFMDMENGPKGIFKISISPGETMTDFSRSIQQKIYKEEERLVEPWANFKYLLEKEISDRRKQKA